MNIAIVHPYPVRSRAVGGVTRLYELARFLARRHRVVVCTHDDGSDPVDPQLAGMGVVQHAFESPRATGLTKARWWLDRSAPYYVHRNLNPALASALAAMDAAEPFDVVHLELGYMAPAIAGLSPRAVRVLAEQEIMPRMLDRLGRTPWRDRTLYEHVASLSVNQALAFDQRTLPMFDLVYAITPEGRDHLQTSAGRPVGVLPHVVALERFSPAAPGEQDAATVLFVGNFAHRPNVHAAQWFVRKVWPSVAASMTGARFEVVGPGLTGALGRNMAGPGVVLSGYQEDLAACYRRATLVVTPVHSGDGMRGKVLEAFASASALVSTSVGLEGVAAIDGQHCQRADDPQSFADAVCAYLADPGLRRSHGLAARALVAGHFDAPVVFERLERDYEAALARRRPARRTIA